MHGQAVVRALYREEIVAVLEGPLLAPGRYKRIWWAPLCLPSMVYAIVPARHATG